MERYKLLLIILLSILVNVTSSQDFLDSKKYREGIQKTLNEDYSGASRRFSVIANKDTSLLPEILELGNTVLKREHRGDYSNPGAIDSTFKILAETIITRLAKMPDDLELNYRMALIKSFNAYWEGFQGNFLEAFADGFIAAQYFEKCMAVDSTSIEYKCALGNYKYWSSVKTESLHWLPFMEDNSETGLESLELCLNGKFATAGFMQFSLAYAYLNENKSEKAKKLIDRLVSKYPVSIRAKVLLAEYYAEESVKKAITVYSNILKYYLKADFDAESKILEIKTKLAKLNFRDGNYDNSLEICEDILSMKISEEKLNLYNRIKLEEVVSIRDSILTLKSALPQN